MHRKYRVNLGLSAYIEVSALDAHSVQTGFLAIGISVPLHAIQLAPDA